MQHSELLNVQEGGMCSNFSSWMRMTLGGVSVCVPDNLKHGADFQETCVRNLVGVAVVTRMRSSKGPTTLALITAGHCMYIYIYCGTFPFCRSFFAPKPK